MGKFWVHTFYNPWSRLAWVLAAATGVAAYLVADRSARSAGLPSPYAPEAGDLLLGVGLGLAVGLAGVARERSFLASLRARLREFFPAPPPRRPGWRILAVRLVVIYALLGWCVWAGVDFVPVLLATAVPFLLNVRLTARFLSDLETGRWLLPEDE